MDSIQTILCIFILFFLYENKVQYNTHYTGKHVNISVPRKHTLATVNLAIATEPSLKEHTLKFFHIRGYTPTTLVQDIQKIKTCVETVQVYRNKQQNLTLAYVSKYKISPDIFVNTDLWDKVSLSIQEKTIIHECSHLTLSTDDHAYSNSPLFQKLEGLRAKQNADTLTEVIVTLARSEGDRHRSVF